MPAQVEQSPGAILPAERRHWCWLGRRRNAQVFAGEGAAAAIAVGALKFRPGHAFGPRRQVVPTQGATGVVDRRVRPALGVLWAGCVAGFAVGIAGTRHAARGQLVLAGAEHLAQGRKIFLLFDQRAGGGEYQPGTEMAQAVEPQALGLVEQGGIGKGAVKLVVIVDAEQCKRLIDGVDQRRIGGRPFSRPNCGR